MSTARARTASRSSTAAARVLVLLSSALPALGAAIRRSSAGPLHLLESHHEHDPGALRRPSITLRASNLAILACLAGQVAVPADFAPDAPDVEPGSSTFWWKLGISGCVRRMKQRPG